MVNIRGTTFSVININYSETDTTQELRSLGACIRDQRHIQMQRVETATIGMYFHKNCGFNLLRFPFRSKEKPKSGAAIS